MEDQTCRFSPGDYVTIPNGKRDGAYEVVAVLKRVDREFNVNFLCELVHCATRHVLLQAMREELLEPIQPRKVSRPC